VLVLVSMNAAGRSATSDGGYDDGYSACPCFWGKLPGSLIREFLATKPSLVGRTVLDLGCGEGKNANALALAGASVDAVDCSALAIANGRRAFTSRSINWITSDALDHLRKCQTYDIVVLYGLLHCFPSAQDISELIALALQKTASGGMHFVVAFNDGPHDLSAHPDFRPTLVSHAFYCEQYRGQVITSAGDSVLHETHPHNLIPHFHSVTRIIAKVKDELP
jgi:tellurite methyltransferase